MAHFFTFNRALLPGDTGIGLFGPAHLLWLLAALLLCLGLARRAPRLTSDGQRRLRRGLAAALGLLEGIRVLSLSAAGQFGVYYLPLHLCGISIFIVLYHALRGTDFSGELLYCLTLPGAACALLFPEWIDYPAANLLSILSFLIHILLVAYPVTLLRSGFRPHPRRLPRCLLFLLLTAGAVYLFDRRFNANYMFLLRPAPHSPLSWFAGFLGVPGYLWGYVPMIAVVWLVLYLPFRKNAAR